MTLQTPEQIADSELRTDDNWTQTSDPAIVREMLVRAIEADRAQREEEVSPPRQMGSGDMCSFGPKKYRVTHYRCDEYRDGTVTDVRAGMIVKSAPSSNPKGFDR